MTFRMPAEWEKHERTLIGWPCRLSAWGATLEQGRREFAAAANAIAAFEPVTMVCATEDHAAGARKLLSAQVEVVVIPMDSSWLRDNGPLYVTDGRKREARHFRFNGWGERHATRDRDARLGATLARRLGDPVRSVDVVLEGGAIAGDGAGLLVAPEGCLMHPTRNWYLTREEVEAALKAELGAARVVWLTQGLAEDMDRDPDRMHYGTDGHVDLFLDFVAPGRCLMLAPEAGGENASHLADAKAKLIEAGIEVVLFPYLAHFEAEGRTLIAPYLNFYICNGAVMVPVTGADEDMDEAALASIGRHFPERQVVGLTMRAALMQGGGLHCMTQQVPAVG